MAREMPISKCDLKIVVNFVISVEHQLRKVAWLRKCRARRTPLRKADIFITGLRT